MSREADTPSSMPSAYKVLSASYIEKHKDRKDLVRRLRNCAHLLESISEQDSQEYPGMEAMAIALVDSGLDHKDKDVRLYTVLCCMEVFKCFAPEAPWDDEQVVHIFQQTIQQLSNLSHTTQPTQPHYNIYLRILELLSEINIGAALVSVVQTSMNEEDPDEEDEERPLDILAELFHTTLHSLRIQHSAMVNQYIEGMIVGCLKEFPASIPVPLIDQLLSCVGQGPTIMVTNPALAQEQQQQQSKKGRKRQSRSNLPLKVPETNPSFMLACSVIRKNSIILANPIGDLLNGLLNGDAHILEQSAISAMAMHEGDEEDDEDDSLDVWTVLYQLAMAVPSTLSAYIGAVSDCLQSPAKLTRRKAVNLLGRLFSADGSKLPTKFHRCFGVWLQRYKDVDSNIRSTYAKCLILLVRNCPDDNVVKQCETMLIFMMNNDEEHAIRTIATEGVCDFAFGTARAKNTCSAQLLQAVGTRVRAKATDERLGAVTALSQIYLKFFTRPILQDIQEAGENCTVEMITEVLNGNCSLIHGSVEQEEDEDDESEDRKQKKERDLKYRWIPSTLIRGFWWASDHKFVSRLIQCMDDLWLGSDISKTPSKDLGPCAGAVGFTILLGSLLSDDDDRNLLIKHPTSNAFMFMKNFFLQRTKIQKALGTYLEARTKARSLPRGSEETFAADSFALRKLEEVAALLPPLEGSLKDNVLSSLHAARDKHIFRLLSSLTTPLQPKSARRRALDELPKRVKSLGDDVASWVRTLARRAVMGSVFNVDIVHFCLCWAAECLKEGELQCCVALMSSVSVALSFSSSICDDNRNFSIVKEMVETCRSTPPGHDETDFKREVAESGLMSFLVSLLAITARSRQKSSSDGLLSPTQLDNRLRKQLLQFCIKDGTPQQARNAVATLATTFSKPGSNNAEENDDESAEQSFSWLLKALTAPSNMNIDSKTIVSTLAALAELSERAPVPFSQRAESAARFALEGILLGRLAGSQDEQSSDSEDDETAKQSASTKKTKRGKRGKKKGLSPMKAPCLLENNELSFACRRSCAAIEFLGRYISATILKGRSDAREDVVMPSEENIRMLFATLTGIIRDHGIPPSNRDKEPCSNRADLAALRQCAAQQLLRLCSSSLKLEGKYLTYGMWHTLGGIFLDEELTVREAVIKEFCDMMKGVGFFRNHEPPSLRFMAYVVFCSDGGNAAKVGKLSELAMKCAKKGVVEMRQAYDRARAAALDEEEDQTHEGMRKYTSEYATYFAFHLLAFHRDTPAVKEKPIKLPGGNLKRPPAHSLLSKRLKWLFDPIVKSLGDQADNISFLLNIADHLTRYTPIDVTADSLPGQKSALSSSLLEENKLSIICQDARNLLIVYAKKDKHLEQHPHSPYIPEFLFRRRSRREKRKEKKSRKADIAKGATPPVASQLEAQPNFSESEDDEKKPARKSKKRSLPKQEEDSESKPETEQSVPTRSSRRRKAKHDTAPPIPSQVSIEPSNDDQSQPTPSPSPSKRARRSLSQATSEGEVDEEEQTPNVKPLGHSNRATRGAKRNNKGLVSPVSNPRPKRTRRSKG